MPTLEIHLTGPLLVAGDASSPGADLTTARRFDGRRLVPYIPATALRGAIRLQLEELLRGAGGAVAGPYPVAAGSPPPAPLDDPVARLFGYSGPDGEREGSRPGTLRFGDALPADAERAAASLRARPGIEIDDLTAAAADRKLFFREVAEAGAGLVFRAPLDLGEATAEDAERLRAAVAATEALGAGKATGGGAVEIRWLDEEEGGEPRQEQGERAGATSFRSAASGPASEHAARAGATVEGDPANARRARVTLTLLAPAHFGDGGPFGNHHATRSHVPGATLRGAVAWTLLRGGRATPEDAAFRALFLGPAAASFGDALPVSASGGEPRVVPVTKRKERGGEGGADDVLVRELARERVGRQLAESGSALYLRADDGDRRFDPVPEVRPGPLVRRTRTRVSIDRGTGAAAAGRLFSIEQLEPVTAGGEPARFVAWIEGIPEEGARLLAGIEGLAVAVGAGRNHGLGSVALDLRFEPEEPAAQGEAAVRELTAAVDREARALAARAGLRPESLDPAPLLLALVAQSDYVPASGAARHPLAEAALVERLGERAPVRAYLRAGAAGGYDERPERRGPLKELLPAIGAGSVYVYEIDGAALNGLDGALAALRRGVGRRAESGCGRFLLHPEPRDRR